MVVRTSRLERITNLVLALLDTPRPLSLREIGGAVAGYPSDPGALRQAFERDKRTLRDGGIPVAVERVDGEDQVGYRILPEHYYLPDLGLDADEEQAIAFALAVVRIEGGVGRDVLAKLGTPGPPQVPPVAVLPSLPALAPLQQAVRSRSRVSFGYRGRRRLVEPYGLLFRSGAWYVVGKDLSVAVPGVAQAVGGSEGSPSDEGALRTFRVDRLEDAPELGDAGAYVPPMDFDASAELRIAPWAGVSRGSAAGRPAEGPGDGGSGRVVAGADDVREVVVEVDAREARSSLAMVGPRSEVERRPDGGVRLRFTIADEGAFVSWVLGCGDAVEVVAPPDLRARVVRALEAALAG